MPNPRARYRWDPAAGRYRAAANGQFVARAAVRRALDQAILGEQRAMLRAFDQLRAGTLTLDEWYAGMRTSVKMVHLWAAASARGGWAQLSASDYGRVGAIVRFHYDRLARFAAQINLRLPLDGRARVRVQMYANAARRTYHDFGFDVAVEAGYVEERNILMHDKESCAQCIEVTGRAWVPVGTLPPVGNRTCLTNCRCYLEYRRAEP